MPDKVNFIINELKQKHNHFIKAIGIHNQAKDDNPDYFFTLEDGSFYSGSFNDDKPNLDDEKVKINNENYYIGSTKYSYSAIGNYEGKFNNNNKMYEGTGKLEWEVLYTKGNKEEVYFYSYNGKFENGKCHGEGTFTFKKDKLITLKYDSSWENGVENIDNRIYKFGEHNDAEFAAKFAPDIVGLNK